MDLEADPGDPDLTNLILECICESIFIAIDTSSLIYQCGLVPPVPIV